MDLIEYLKRAQSEALKQHIMANTVMLNSNIKLVREGYYSLDGRSITQYPPMICGLSAYLTDELPDDIAFCVFDSPNPSPSYEEDIRQKARRELLDELKEMTFEQITGLIERGY